MSRRFLISLFVFLVIGGIDSLFAQRLNRLNKNKERTGKWILYSDSAKTKKLFKGRFRNGNSIGLARYYNMEGVLDRKERTRKKVLYTRIYFPNGNVMQKGKAEIVNTDKKIHYYFFGPWKHYSADGKLIKYVYYEKGLVVRTVYVDRKNTTNDSLLWALNYLDKTFNENNRIQLDKIAGSFMNPDNRERLQEELYQQDSSSFMEIERIFQVHGYPSRSKVNESVNIPFFILSNAPLSLREKYLPLLIAAAEKGDLEWKTLAFYIDKIKVAKHEPQIYGTQQVFKKNAFPTPYITAEPEGLEERRKKVGLD